MAELTKDMVQRRLDSTASATFQPEIPGLPGILFVRMGLKEKGKSSRAYSGKLKELYAEGGYFSEPMIKTIIERAAKENGIDPKVIKKRVEIERKFYESIPPELAGPYDQLTEEEVGLLSPEERTERDKAIEERGLQIMEFMKGAYNEEQLQIFEQAKQLEDLERELRSNTAERHAREHQLQSELLMCARKVDDQEQPYFSDIEEISALEHENRQGLVQLYTKWQQFKEGYLPQFFRPDHTH